LRLNAHEKQLKTLQNRECEDREGGEDVDGDGDVDLDGGETEGSWSWLHIYFD